MCFEMKEDQSHPTVIVGKITSTSSRRRDGESLVFDEPSVRKTMETSESYLPYSPCSWLELARRVFSNALVLTLQLLLHLKIIEMHIKVLLHAVNL
ncbi:hypothetical protein Sjap_010521 [Stephania japonica]|uniref:Uncharacterized protein n=1 Tax=Stephania japonica TaxID=461633 RepID=A0AAP0J9J5_9MAGN